MFPLKINNKSGLHYKLTDRRNSEKCFEISELEKPSITNKALYYTKPSLLIMCYFSMFQQDYEINSSVAEIFAFYHPKR